MKAEDKRYRFKNIKGSALIPTSPDAIELLNSELKDGQEVMVSIKQERDLSFHKAFFSMLSYIYKYLPTNFTDKVPSKLFYTALKELKGDYELIEIGSKQVKQYKSISFSKMDEIQFKNYVRELLPFIYEDVIRPLLPEYADAVIDNIEDEYKRTIARL